MAKNISDINESVRNISSGAINPADTDIDNFSDYVVNSEGHRVVSLKYYEVVPAKKILNYYQGRTEDTGRTTKKHIRLELMTDDGEHIETKLYEKGVAYFMNSIAAQTGGAARGMKLSEVLNYITTHYFDVWVEFSSQYGVQVRYSDPDKQLRQEGLM